MQKPCVILRNETEWTEIVEHGCGILAGADPEKIMAGYAHFKGVSGLTYPPIFGDGQAAGSICRAIVEHLN